MNITRKLGIGTGIFTVVVGSLIAYYLSIKDIKDKGEKSSNIEKQEEKPYFAELSMDNRSGISMTSGDFTNDGWSDLIVGSKGEGMGEGARLYFFENDGKGNLIKRDYFAELPMDNWSGMAITGEDFNNDGNLDVIVGAKGKGMGEGARLYFFENDGKGNFKLKSSK